MKPHKCFTLLAKQKNNSSSMKISLNYYQTYCYVIRYAIVDLMVDV